MLFRSRPSARAGSQPTTPDAAGGLRQLRPVDQPAVRPAADRMARARRDLRRGARLRRRRVRRGMAPGWDEALRFETAPLGPQNAQEFGTSADPEEFRSLYAMSPYYHLADRTPYPAVLRTPRRMIRAFPRGSRESSRRGCKRRPGAESRSCSGSRLRRGKRGAVDGCSRVVPSKSRNACARSERACSEENVVTVSDDRAANCRL